MQATRRRLWSGLRDDPMNLPPRLRRFTLSVHLAVSVGWVGTVVAYLALGIAAVRSDDVQIVRSAWIGMELVGWYVIVPLAVSSWLTGIFIAAGTKWGLFRHYWVLFSLVLTTLAAVVLILHMPGVSDLADIAQRGGSEGLEGLDAHVYAQLKQGDLLHPAIGLLVLLAVHMMNVYKPPGLTPYGRRKQREERARPSQRALAEA